MVNKTQGRDMKGKMKKVKEITLEELIAGKLPAKSVIDKKPMAIRTSVKTELKRMLAIRNKAESASVKQFKKYSVTELRALEKGYDEVRDAMYLVRNIVEEALPDTEYVGDSVSDSDW